MTLSDVGRMKMNARTELEIPEETRVLTKEDIIQAIKILDQHQRWF